MEQQTQDGTENLFYRKGLIQEGNILLCEFHRDSEKVMMKAGN